jgi:predicted MPP superfamily phosphohydrolase
LKRFEIRCSDIPLQRRNLPLLPRRLPAQIDLEMGIFHIVLAGLDILEKISWPLLLAAIGLVDGIVGLAGGGLDAVFAGGGQAFDWYVLRALPRREISFGPAKTQWFTLALLRLAPLALAIGLHAGGFDQLVANGVLQWSPRWLGAAIIQAAAVLLVLRGYLIEPKAIHTATVGLDTILIPTGIEIRLLHVADVHLERTGVRERQLIKTARELQPDAILFTGDFLNLSNVFDKTAQQQARDLWQSLRATAPVYAVTGSPPVDPPCVVGEILAGSDACWLRDEIAMLHVHGAELRLVGLTCSHDPRRDGDSLRRVLSPTTQSHFDTSAPLTILLYHAPDLAPQAAYLGVVDLQLSGHTHGGQVRVPGFGALITSSFYLKALEMGLYQLGDMLLHVSRGIGLEGLGAPRVRLNCRPQLTLFLLRGRG